MSCEIFVGMVRIEAAMAENLISPVEAAKILGRTLASLRDWIVKKRITPFRRLGRLYFDRTEIERLSASPEVPQANGRRKGK